ncbi:hypothetical protein ZIOFF_065609 [Zingiber officinale]|uniref:Uncharacterized protein n=1 Tax=Zingiber officinale TaxID=94328 RepID=A0A8J5K769_ZINOF|nr:hypothetical protein ZIOFF_065609 [Zingiber officinale]
MFSPYSFTSSCPNLFASDPSPHSHFLHRSRKRERAHQRKGSRRKASGREGEDAHAIPTKESSGKRQVMRFWRRRAWEKGKFSSIIDTDRHSSGITRLNDRARQDAAVLRLGFLKLDARAREDTRKIDLGVKEKAARLKHLATDRAQSDLKRVADQHWSDGALEISLFL